MRSRQYQQRSSFLATLLIVVTIAGLVFIAKQTYGQSFVQPPSLTPSADVAPTLSASPNAERKLGSLLIGTSTAPAKFCLNAATENDPPPGCISSWSDLSSLVGSFVRLSSAAISGDTQQIASYGSAQSGQARLSGSPSTNPLAYNLVVEPPSGGFCQINEGESDGRCSLTGNGCRYNSECHYNDVSTSVYAAGNAALSAAQFEGRFYVAPTLTPPGNYQYGRLCLNGVDDPLNDGSGGYCISGWQELASTATPTYWKLQSTGPGTPLDYQSAHVFVSGAANFDSVVVGDSTAAPLTYSCGDGLCAGSETVSSCFMDCADVSALSQFTVTPVDRGVSMTIQTNRLDYSNLTTDDVRVLVLRSSGAPTMTPQNGAVYGLNSTLGNATVVYSSVADQLATVTSSEMNLTNCTAYTYTAHQGNMYPRYASTPKTATVTVGASTYTISVTLAGVGGGSVASIAPDNRLSCAANGPNCTKSFTSCSPTVQIKATANADSIFSAWSGDCAPASNKPVCTLTMNGNKNVTANFLKGGGPPPGGPPKGT